MGDASSRNTIATEGPRRRAGPPATIIDSQDTIRESYADYLRDESRFGPAACDRLVFASGEEDVAGALADATESGVEVTVSAGRTGIVGGAVPRRGTLLSLARLDRVLGIRALPDGRFVLRAEPGVTIAALADRLERRELGIEEGALEDHERGALRAFLGSARPPFYPPDPTEGNAHLGATLATNASGARSFRYGATRAHVQGLRVCLPSGAFVDVERGACRAAGRRFALVVEGGGEILIDVPSYAMPATKNAAGYYAAPDMDLVDLFVGSEGTLGVITEARIVLSPRPERVLSALAFFPTDGDAIAFVRKARGDFDGGRPPAPVDPAAFELLDSRSLDFLRACKREGGSGDTLPELPPDAGAGVLFEQEYSEDRLPEIYDAWESLLSAHGSSMERTWGGMEEADLARLKALRHGVAEEVNKAIARAKAAHPEIHKIGTDAAVPAAALEEMMACYRQTLDGTDLRYVIFGHVGDNHLHLNVMPRDPGELALSEDLALFFAERAVRLGGTVSAEHGIGKLKHAFLRLQYGEEGVREMAAVKRAVDPRGILNRDVMFPQESLRSH